MNPFSDVSYPQQTEQQTEPHTNYIWMEMNSFIMNLYGYKLDVVHASPGYVIIAHNHRNQLRAWVYQEDFTRQKFETMYLPSILEWMKFS